ncbi:MAG: hypothetical protein NC181_01955 [Clostridium sp.]|nr:hypothetical protein [Clostridium sp.]MCM1444070.1 hypothetical protein [Candidatus Amulumruptor caecigallinarius]
MKKIGILVAIFITLTLCSGCSKDGILDFYKGVNEKIGDTVLTNNIKLKGDRKFG